MAAPAETVRLTEWTTCGGCAAKWGAGRLRELVAKLEAGGVTAGGHTIRSEEPIFGLAVQGVVHPDRVWTKGGAQPGDVLVLSKPLGTGIVLAGGDADEKPLAIQWMRQINRGAAEQLA